MPLNKAQLILELDAKAATVFGPAYTPISQEMKDGFWKIIAETFVDHFKNNTVVNVTSVTGVTTGNFSSGPGTGTIS